ncbi:MAG TPA: hypothetical protein PKM48_09415 [Parvularculaceae bacterium]|nr:hypothetical protein [Parvularculaceae bacterium]HNS86841.1 hypothetical protein [Parvularculaceae bacterium]
MKRFIAFSAAAAIALAAGVAYAESIEDMCLRVSEDWGTEGDVAAQCSCLADEAAADSAVEEELRSLADSYSNDEEAYDAASDATKSAFDACSVDS